MWLLTHWASLVRGEVHCRRCLRCCCCGSRALCLLPRFQFTSVPQSSELCSLLRVLVLPHTLRDVVADARRQRGNRAAEDVAVVRTALRV